jgi:hypothetical protein
MTVLSASALRLLSITQGEQPVDDCDRTEADAECEAHQWLTSPHLPEARAQTSRGDQYEEEDACSVHGLIMRAAPRCGWRTDVPTAMPWLSFVPSGDRDALLTLPRPPHFGVTRERLVSDTGPPCAAPPWWRPPT